MHDTSNIQKYYLYFKVRTTRRKKSTTNIPISSQFHFSLFLNTNILTLQKRKTQNAKYRTYYEYHAETNRDKHDDNEVHVPWE